RASEASQGVFGQACFALELSMQKQEQLLKEDPFLGDANWNLVWRYLPLFTAESFFTRLSKGHITLSADELEDIRDTNDRARKLGDNHRSFVEVLKAWFRERKGGFSYSGIPHRLKSPWYEYHTKFLFADAGGEAVWGNLESFLANHTAAGDDSVESWTGHLKHSRFDGGITGTIDKFSRTHDHTREKTQAQTCKLGGGRGEEKHEAEPSRSLTNPLAAGTSLDTPTATTAATPATENAVAGPAPGSPPSNMASFEGEDHDQNDVQGRKGSMSKRMFQRAATFAQNAGISLSLTHDHGRHDKDGLNEQGIDKSELLEARFRFLQSLKAEYFKAKREGKLGSSGKRERERERERRGEGGREGQAGRLRVLTESINNAHDKVDKGGELDGWAELSGRFSSGWESLFAKYMNWWPARPCMAIAIARRVSFQIDLAWNFLEAHHESNVK
ncbi:unnamed protein product, partial [Ectocarpus fasciculatus]